MLPIRQGLWLNRRGMPFRVWKRQLHVGLLYSGKGAVLLGLQLPVQLLLQEEHGGALLRIPTSPTSRAALGVAQRGALKTGHRPKRIVLLSIALANVLALSCCTHGPSPSGKGSSASPVTSQALRGILLSGVSLEVTELARYDLGARRLDRFPGLELSPLPAGIVLSRFWGANGKAYALIQTAENRSQFFRFDLGKKVERDGAELPFVGATDR